MEETSSDNPVSHLTIEESNALVEEHYDWAGSIARSVARGWNLDWQNDGLDGAAMEALIFCSRRFDPTMGIPFKGYARRRIHEAATEAARKSKGWVKGGGADGQNERLAREVAVELFELFPDLRSGILPLGMDEDGGGAQTRASIRQLLIGATLVTTRQGLSSTAPDDLLDTKKMVTFIARLEVIHQIILWRMYWDGDSMRTIASGWEMDELNVIREHQAIIEHLEKCIERDKPFEPLKIRPGLKKIALELKRSNTVGPFIKFLSHR